VFVAPFRQGIGRIAAGVARFAFRLYTVRKTGAKAQRDVMRTRAPFAFLRVAAGSNISTITRFALARLSSFRGAKRRGISLLLLLLLLRLAQQERFLATLGMTGQCFFQMVLLAQTSARLPVLLWQRRQQSPVRPSQRRRESPQRHPPRLTPPTR